MSPRFRKEQDELLAKVNHMAKRDNTLVRDCDHSFVLADVSGTNEWIQDVFPKKTVFRCEAECDMYVGMSVQ